MLKISVISHIHIGATYKPFQHIQRFHHPRPPPNKQSKHPTPPIFCTSVIFLPIPFKLERSLTRLAGHLVWKALTHAKGKHTEPHQQLSGRKGLENKNSVVVMCFFVPLRCSKKKKGTPRNNRSWKIEPEFVSSGRCWFVFALFNFSH